MKCTKLTIETGMLAPILLWALFASLTPVQAATPSAPPWGSNYQLVFCQDYTTMISDSQILVNGGTALNSGNVWISHYHNGKDDSDFINPIGHDHPFGIDGNGSGSNYLTIRAQHDPANALNNWNGDFTMGALSSQDTSGLGFTQKYGYFEASIWLPNIQGATNNDDPNTHAGFWLLGHNSGSSGGYAEIDVTEAYGNWGTGPNQSPVGNPNNTIMTWHDWFTNNSTYGDSSFNDPKMTSGFHQYGVDVEPTGITWYYDRKPMWSAHIYADAQVALGVILDFGMGGGNYNNTANTGYNWNLTASPSDMKVQYVAVWASPNSPNYKPKP